MFHASRLPYFAKLPVRKIKAFQFTVQAAMEDLENASSTVKGWKARFLAGDWSGETWFCFWKFQSWETLEKHGRNNVFVFYQSVPPGCIEDLGKRPFSQSWLLPAGVQRKEKAAAKAKEKADAKAAAKKAEAEAEANEEDDPDADWGEEWGDENDEQDEDE